MIYLYNKYLLILFLSTPIFAADIKQELYLVIGSNRLTTLGSSEIIKKIHNTGQSDCSHKNSFAGQATTFDMTQCKDSDAKHMVGDATSFDFSPFSIKAAYIERLPTVKGPSAAFSAADNNLIGNVIKNIAPHMPSSARLEIELDPYLKLCFNNPQQNELEASIKANPFHAWHSYLVAFISLRNLNNQTFTEKTMADKCPPETNRLIMEYLAGLKKLLLGLSQYTGIAFADLSRRIFQEMSIYEELLDCPTTHAKFVSLFPGGACLSNEDFDQSYQNAQFCEPPKTMAHNLLKEAHIRPDLQGTMRTFCYYDPTFLNDSLSNALLAMYAVERNQQHIIDFIQQNGFKNVEINLTTSPHNGRTNVWIISAVKQ